MTSKPPPAEIEIKAETSINLNNVSYYKSGMRVMFYNTANIKLPPFLIGRFGMQTEANKPIFKIKWETPMLQNWEINSKFYSKKPLILDNINPELEIKIRSSVHEARLFFYGARIRQCLSLSNIGQEFVGETTITALGMEQKNVQIGDELNCVDKDVDKANQITLYFRKSPPTEEKGITIPSDLFHAACSRANFIFSIAKTFEEQKNKNRGGDYEVPYEYQIKKIDPLLKWVYKHPLNPDVCNRDMK